MPSSQTSYAFVMIIYKIAWSPFQWFQDDQWTRPQRLRAENTGYFLKILIPYFIYLAGFFSIQIWLGGY